MQSSDIWHLLMNLFRLEGKKMWCGNVEKNIVRERLCLYILKKKNFEYGAMTTIIIIVEREKIYHDLIMCLYL
jgi:hypothetical protein